MNKTLWIIIAIVVVLVFWSVSAYNGLVGAQEDSITQWSNVETQYQRRADLIPNLVNTVKGYASHEKEVFESVTKARAEATSVKIDASNITPAMMQQYQAAQSGITSALSRLIAVAERYPDIKANQNFLELQAQLEGTENRIAVERRRYNEMTRDYNVKIRNPLNIIVVSIGGFERRPLFEAEEGSEKAPEVKF
ncbi:MAG: LemA family protein [Cyclobacteriaceae bacterium]|nr:LemA family protein [Cyclobacteriaceae bacterium]